jgi:uncharacterized membrane protein YhaH (DUF805 family)
MAPASVCCTAPGYPTRVLPRSWFLLALRRYAQFSGRSRRKEYWFFTLFLVLASIVALGLDMALGTMDEEPGAGLLGGLLTLALLLPSIAVTIRRLHDTGRSGWWMLVFLIPVIGLVGFYFMVKDGDAGDNRFGPDPKAEPAPA